MIFLSFMLSVLTLLATFTAVDKSMATKACVDEAFYKTHSKSLTRLVNKKNLSSYTFHRCRLRVSHKLNLKGSVTNE